VEDNIKDIKNILVIKLRHIGDVLLTIPVFRALRESFPAAKISALINSGTEGVLVDNPLIDNIIIFKRDIKRFNSIRRYKAELSFLKDIRKHSFDMTVDLTGGDRAAIVSFLSGAKYRIGIDPMGRGFIGKRYLYSHLSRPSGTSHMVLQNLEILKKVGISTKDLSVNIYIDKETEISIESMFQVYGIKDTDVIVHIHPTSRWLFKCWRDEFMAEIIKWFIKRDIKVIITSSQNKDELIKVNQIISLIKNCENYKKNLIDLSGKTTLKQLAAISKKATIFFGVDSAPMHIAAAVNTPVVSLFGPSGAFNWGPWDNTINSEEVYNKRNGIQYNGKHIVIQKEWDCVPCGKDGCSGSKISKCLYEITPDIVKGIIKKQLDKIL